MEITLINPLSHAELIVNPIGLQIIEKSCKDAEIKTKIVDLSNDFLRENRMYDSDTVSWLKSKIDKIDSTIVGISVMNASFPWVIKIAEILKQNNPEVKIILGGPHITALKEKIFSQTDNLIEFLVVYEGEVVIQELICFISEPSKKMLPNNVYWYNDGIIKYSEIKYSPASFETVKDTDFNNYLDADTVGVEVGRGCPFRCYYCSSHEINGGRIEYRNVNEILKESQKIYELLHTHNNEKKLVAFTHDNFLSNRAKFKEFVNLKKKLGYNFTYACLGRIDAVDDIVIDELMDSRCVSVFFGIETGSQRMQTIIRKNLRLDKKIHEKVKKLIFNNMVVEMNFIIGFPEETYKDFLSTIELASELSSIGYKAIVDYSYITPEPGSDLEKKTKKENYLMVKGSKFYSDLKNAEINPETLNVECCNHLYTIKNNDYDIINIEKATKKYFELLRLFFVSVKIMHDLIKSPYKDIFEALKVKKCLVSFLEDFILKNEKTLHNIGKELILYEICRYKKNKDMLNSGYVEFEYPIQDIFKEIILYNSEIKDVLDYERNKTTVIFR